MGNFITEKQGGVVTAHVFFMYPFSSSSRGEHDLGGGEGIIQIFLQGVSMGKRYIIVFSVVSHCSVLDRCSKKEWNGNCNVLYVPKKKAIYSLQGLAGGSIGISVRA